MPGYTGGIDREEFVEKVNSGAGNPFKYYTDLDEMLADVKERIEDTTGCSIKSLEWKKGDETYNIPSTPNTTVLPTDYSILKFNFFADVAEPLDVSLHVGAESALDNKIQMHIESLNARSLGLNGLRVDGKDGKNATEAMGVVEKALQKVSTQRSAFGAVQNRLEHTIANLDNVVENTTAAEAQIRDTDMATEMVKYSNNNILAQAGEAMLAQANQSSQGILTLLR